MLIGEPKTPHFYDFWIFEPVVEIPGHLNKIKKSQIFSKILFVINLGFFELHNRGIFRKGGHRKMMKIRLKKSQKSWIWDQYLPENMK